MKKIILIVGIILLIGCKSKIPKKKPVEVKTEMMVKVNLMDISDAQKNKAYELGKRVLSACNTSKFKPFNESEATPQVIQNATQDRLTKTCLKFRLKYGDFKDLQLVEVYKNNVDESMLFRYKALYQKKIANKELQVTLNKDHKVSSIKSKDWMDHFQY